MQAAKVGGAYAEYVVVPAVDVARAPAGRPLGEVASVPLCGLTALQLLRKAGLRAGDRLLVHGASGGVGTLAVQIGTALGAEVSAATSAGNIELVGGLGAVRVFHYAGGDLGADYDVVLDATNHFPFRRARHLLRPDGTAATVNPFAERLAPDWLAWTRGGRRLRSLLVQPSGADLTTLAAWLESGKVRPVVERTYRLEEAPQAHLRSETGRVRGKLVLVVDDRLAALTPQTHGHDVART
jgi:NADPH:quinone reductase-like Zn-dependent oxidoreductase